MESSVDKNVESSSTKYVLNLVRCYPSSDSLQTRELCTWQTKDDESDTITVDALAGHIESLFPELPTNCVIKYRDEDADLITIGCQRDLDEAIAVLQGKTSPESPSQYLYFFILCQGTVSAIAHLTIEPQVDKDKTQDVRPRLLIRGGEWISRIQKNQSQLMPPNAATGAFLNEMRLIVTTVSYSYKKSKKKKKIVDGSAIVVAEVQGRLEYMFANKDDESTDEPKHIVTRFLGEFSGKDSLLRLIEFEMLKGHEDNFALPRNFKCDFRGNSLHAELVNEDLTSLAQIVFDFNGVVTPCNGLLLSKIWNIDPLGRPAEPQNPLRKYNLYLNGNSTPSVRDQKLAFKKLTRNADFWYDRTKRGKLRPRTKEEKRKQLENPTKCCPNCGSPLEETFDLEGNTKTQCPNNHGYCRASSYNDYYDYW